MTGKVAVVTGANAGLGYQTTLQLARSGATVVMACRSPERAERARGQLLTEAPGASTLIMRLDVSEPESIAIFGRHFAQQVGSLDLLINNAGIVGTPLQRNSVGHELQLATNYLGMFALTGTLLPMFRTDVPSRIVNIGSLSHRLAKLDLDDINWEKGRYGPMRAYARSKLAVLTFTMELNRRLQLAGSKTMALAAHPGFAATEIGKDNSLMNPKNPVGKWFNHKMEAKIPTAAEAARPILLAARNEGVRGGDYYGPGGWLEIAGEPDKARVNPAARDIATGKRLWALSEAMTGVSYLADS